jgi:hypothetical protein
MNDGTRGGASEKELEMRNFSLTVNMNAARRAVIGASLAVTLTSPVVLPQSATALPKSCIIRSYFQTAEMEKQVGMRSSCPGATKWGKVTKFVEVETVDLVPDGPSGPGGPGGLPCEFLVTGCPNLPVPRFQ